MSKLTPVEKRKARIRKKVSGTTARPRMSVYKSLRYIYAQVIDDSTGRTVAFASSLSKELKGKDDGDKREDAKRVGKLIADCGFEPFDVGGLAQALHLEHMTLLWVRMVRVEKRSPHITWAALRRA